MNICQLIWCNIPADLSLQQPFRGNLKPYMLCGILLRFLCLILMSYKYQVGLCLTL